MGVFFIFTKINNKNIKKRNLFKEKKHIGTRKVTKNKKFIKQVVLV